ncbi:sulfatase-like hydrolase/transferase [Enterococcus sp. 669A]|uniref:Sulfatase-like hydrolase/transferase n=1 Tax=Candidatus Enterococcus moelleringii TaxID=2815325 RepID=A0ABS3L5Q6_9ENTE|nr:alkaline phosphatase family protein [Enterococcus sp. 669A]MBO1304947.1 sulfatase-like hydrolase/transferase [Enterococcus sp. 669A]
MTCINKLRKHKKLIKIIGGILAVGLLIIASNLFLQLGQNDFSFDLAFKFAFSWHTEKFFLGCLVLLIFYLFLTSIMGSFLFGSLFYTFLIVGIGIADFLKMKYRSEPIYPDDLKMVGEFGMIRDIVGWPLFIGFLLLLILGTAMTIFSLYRSRKLSKRKQIIRLATLVISTLGLVYISHFNNPDNLLRKAYNKTALWIPYSQQMNYYNTGFMGGFLYNLRVEPMEEPAGYSREAIKKITEKYNSEVKQETSEETPNIVYIMNESFSDPSRLEGIQINGGDPLADYRSIADETYSGQMLSQNYGGGTANIEFEALTSFSMEPFNPQMTTPYTMLVPKMEQIPSLVSLLKERNYRTTAIHPYNTSMYKRKDVYDVFGFDQFLDEDTMEHTDKQENNEYISDASAYEEIWDLLDQKSPQFVHLVTMQTHMPYDGKYSVNDFQAFGDNNGSVNNYLQDIYYASQSLKAFLEKLDTLDQRTLVVFWGDHLPGIYNDTIQIENAGHTLHETEFFLYDNKHQLKNQDQQGVVTSPFYFTPDLFSQAGLQTTGFHQLLLALQEEIPAFEKGMYYQSGQWGETVRLNQAQEKIYQDYQMIQYDVTAGEQYSLQENFFEE